MTALGSSTRPTGGAPIVEVSSKASSSSSSPFSFVCVGISSPLPLLSPSSPCLPATIAVVFVCSPSPPTPPSLGFGTGKGSKRKPEDITKMVSAKLKENTHRNISFDIFIVATTTATANDATTERTTHKSPTSFPVLPLSYLFR